MISAAFHQIRARFDELEQNEQQSSYEVPICTRVSIIALKIPFVRRGMHLQDRHPNGRVLPMTNVSCHRRDATINMQEEDVHDFGT